MPHVQAAPGNIVQLDNGITVDRWSVINVDVTLPLAVAALAASPPTIVQLDSVAAPQWPTGNTVPVGVFAAAVTDGSFQQVPPVGTLAIGVTGGNTYIYAKTGSGPSVWKKVQIS